jgi:hypothetical protein
MTLFVPGQKYQPLAADLNDQQAMLREYRLGKLLQGSGELHTPVGSVVIWIKNISDAKVNEFEVLGLDDPVTTFSDNETEFKYNLFWKATKPSTTTPHYGKYVVLQEPAESQGFARAIIHGITLVKLNITHASDSYVEIEHEVTATLKTSALGSSRILWKTSGTGSSDKWGLSRLGEPSGEILVKNSTGSAIAAGSSGTATVHTGTAGSESSTGQTITVYNRTSVSWANDKYGSAALLNFRGPYVSPQQT